MRERIERHRRSRPEGWTTLEAPIDVVSAIRDGSSDSRMVLVDCATIWIANLCWENRLLEDEALESFVLDRVRELGAIAATRETVVVSNEVGNGIVPESPVGRRFRDLQGFANQLLARAADRVVLMVAGIPLVVKGSAETTGVGR